MKVAIAVPAEANGRPLWDHPRFLGPERLLVDGFAELGHEATIVCHAPDTFPSALPAIAVERPVFGDVGFWREGGFDVVIVMTWLTGYQDVVASASSAGAFVVSRGDSDGLVGARAHPGPTLRYAYHSVPWLTPRLRSVWFWGKKVAYLHREYDQAIVAGVERADATTVETDVARDELVRFLQRSGAAHLTSKVHVAPYSALEPRFLQSDPGETNKERLLYAIGRWGDPSKNTGLLTSVLRGYLAADTGARAVVAGSGGERVPRETGSARCEYIGHVDRDAIVDLARSARICLVTSRWESFHVGAHEAAAMGATVVGTPIPAVRSLAMAGQFGTAARSHHRRDVQAALATEMDRWDRGLRDPLEIAAFWRERLSPRAVAARFAEAARL